MVAATPVDSVINPSNPAQRYVLWGNGRVDAYGGALPVTGPDFFHRIDQQVAVAIHITNWTTCAGYILDCAGAFHEFNGAPHIDRDPGGDFGFTLGLPYLEVQHRYVDWSWNPSGSTSGYVVDHYGEIFPFGGETEWFGAIFSTPAVRGFKMSWSPSKKAMILDESGALWPRFGATAPAYPPPYFSGRDVTRDLVVTDWSTTKGYVLTSDGATHPFGGAPSAMIAGPYRAGQDVARELQVLSAADPVRFWQIHSGGQQYEYVASTPPTVVAGGGVSEQQRITITGTPTGGTFTLTYSGQTTAAIARNAAASAVQTALENLSNIGVGDVVVTGGPGPGAPWVVAFAGALGVLDVAQMTATSSLTGGTSPTVSVATQTGGLAGSPASTVTTSTRPDLTWSYNDPQGDSQAAWELYVFTQTFVTGHVMTDPSVWASSALIVQSGVNRSTRGVTSPIDLDNGTYRMYVRAKDTADQWSAWSNRGWTQNVPAPATPTGLTATANQTAGTVALSVSATTGGTAAFIRFLASDDNEVTWAPVVGADAVPIASTTTATDRFAPLGITRKYKAETYNTAPRVKSAASNIASATLTNRTYMLHAVDDSSLGGEVAVHEPPKWTQIVSVGVFQGLDAEWVTVVKNGAPKKSRRGTIGLQTLDVAAWNLLAALVTSGSTLVYRDPFGAVMFCDIAEDWNWEQLPAAPLPGESTPLRHAHSVSLPIVSVGPPVTAS